MPSILAWPGTRSRKEQGAMPASLPSVCCGTSAQGPGLGFPGLAAKAGQTKAEAQSHPLPLRPLPARQPWAHTAWTSHDQVGRRPEPDCPLLCRRWASHVVNVDPTEHTKLGKEGLVLQSSLECVYWYDEVGRGMQSQKRWQLLEKWTQLRSQRAVLVDPGSSLVTRHNLNTHHPPK